jgi:hypothetical protein
MKLIKLLNEIQIKEGKQVGELYHYTTFYNLLSILKSDSMKGSYEEELDDDYSKDEIEEIIEDLLEDLESAKLSTGSEKQKDIDEILSQINYYRNYHKNKPHKDPILSNKYWENYSFISTSRNKHFLRMNKPTDALNLGIKSDFVRITLNGNKLSNKYKILPIHHSGAGHDESEERIIISNKNNLNLIGIRTYIKSIEFYINSFYDPEILEYFIDFFNKNNIHSFDYLLDKKKLTIDEMFTIFKNNMKDVEKAFKCPVTFLTQF